VARRILISCASIIAAVTFGVAGCSSHDGAGSMRDEPNAPAAATPSTSAPNAAPDANCDDPGTWTCAELERFEDADTYAQLQAGVAGIVVHDRQTGATWANANADTSMWAASTIKLAMAADLLERDASGAIALSDQDRSWITDMLVSSDDYAADQLWYEYSGDDNWTFNDDFARMGMTGLEPQPYEDGWPYWGYQMCTPQDLVALMNYVLDDLAAPLRDQILPLMQSVADDQRWGVWAVGPAGSPGVKDGWTDDLDDLSTVGFVGPNARYTVAIMDDLNGEVDFDTGKEILSQIVSTMFDGAFS
jgi:hypothetical protein